MNGVELQLGQSLRRSVQYYEGQTSNEALLEGKTVVIKCAASATDSVGVTFKMLDRLDLSLARFNLDLSLARFNSMMLPLNSGPCHPKSFAMECGTPAAEAQPQEKFGIVRRRSFEQNRRLLGRIRLDEV
jgi:hypothetical protein